MKILKLIWSMCQFTLAAFLFVCLVLPLFIITTVFIIAIFQMDAGISPTALDYLIQILNELAQQGEY